MEVENGIFANETHDKEFDAYFESRGENAPVEEEEAEQQQEAAPSDDSDKDVDSTNETEEAEDAAVAEEEEAQEEAQEEPKNKDAELAHNYKKALKQERTKRQDLERQVKEAAERTQKIENYLRSLQANENQQQQQEEIPDKETDPLGYNNYMMNNLYKQFENLQNNVQVQQKNTAYNKFVEVYKNQAAQYAQEQPDFGEAYQYALKSFANEYEAAGMNQEEIAKQLKEDEEGLVQRAFQTGKNPGEIIYNIAKVRGYAPKTQESQKQKTSKLDTVNKGVKAARTLPRGGRTAGKALDPEDVDSMTNEEFEKFWSQYEREAKGY